MQAVITGASRGIGRAITLDLAKAGYTTTCCSRNPEKLENLAKEVKAVSSSGIRTFPCDVSDRKELDGFAAFVKEGGKTDVLINNAGVFIPGQIGEEDEGSLELMMKTNLYSAYYLTRNLLDGLIEKRGHIINICSVASLKAYPNGGSYSISKYALMGFSQNLRLELQDKGVRVTAISPGPVFTDSWAGSDVSPERLMAPEDISAAVLSCIKMSDRTVVEDMVLRPQLGDL